MPPHLLPVESLNVKSELDIYGFAILVEEITGLKRPTIPMATWVHGWNFQPLTSARTLSAHSHLLSYRRIMRNQNEKNVLEALGFDNILVGGLPFMYVRPSGISRQKDSLVVCAERLHYPILEAQVKRYGKLMEELDFEYKKSLKEINFCFTGEDFNEDNPLVKMARDRGYGVLLGGHKRDSNSLKRLRQIFDYHEYGLTNTLGSHLVYSNYCGCSMGISFDNFYLALHDLGEYGNNRDEDNIDDRLWNEWTLSGEAQKQYSFLMVSNINEIGDYSQWANSEIGLKDRIADERIGQALCWTSAAYSKAALLYVRDRVTRRRCR